MKAKTRKRLVISSVAMLLVAVLALGTATFAWFTQNTSATASGIFAKTVKASNLLIQKYGQENWSNSVDYALGTSEEAHVLIPASSGNGTDWFTGFSDYAANVVDEETEEIIHPGGELHTNATPVTVALGDANPTYVFTDMLNIKNDGAANSGAVDYDNVQITWSWPQNASNFIRVAFVPATNEGVLDIPQGETFGDFVYAKNDSQYVGLTAAAGTGENITPNVTRTVSVGTIEPNTAKYYRLFVWFEGQDANCVDANAASTLSDLSFTVQGTPSNLSN